MRLNESTCLYNSRVVLRPYRRWHVPQYHAWMEDETLREQTASERLTLQEEEDMQRSWRLDEDKLTFIVHLRSPTAPSPTADPAGFLAAHNDASTMIGDANLFLHAVPPPSSPPVAGASASSSPATPSPSPSRRAELEIMFPPSARHPARSGVALSTLHLFLSYAARALALPPAAFFARIGLDNAPSRALFAKLGLHEVKRVDVFREVEVAWVAADADGWPWEAQAGWAQEHGALDDPRDEARD
ncbi:hypothetical protein JCM1841_002783 [Sporobolomyces salmonicolor]